MNKNIFLNKIGLYLGKEVLLTNMQGEQTIGVFDTTVEFKEGFRCFVYSDAFMVWDSAYIVPGFVKSIEIHSNNTYDITECANCDHPKFIHRYSNITRLYGECDECYCEMFVPVATQYQF